jgi:uncharacterized protein (DUF1800 family)
MIDKPRANRFAMTSIQWNETTAAHLYRRAAWGATSEELALAVRDGLERTVDRLVDYESISNAALEQRIKSMNLRLQQPDPQTAVDIVRLWLTRMIYTARPLEERMTFFWHNHFATSIDKVGESTLMRNQNDLFRRFALGNFRALCSEVARDPAMLVWLDNFTSVKQHANENFGRELLELFTLGRGHYTEADVQAAARAFTGWTLDLTAYPVVFMYDDEIHDHGSKTFLGFTGDLDGNDIIRIICGLDQHGRFIATKLFAFFAYDDPEPEVVARLAKAYLNSGNDTRTLVKEILLSPEMYSSRAIWTKVKSPLEHVVGACRMLQVPDELPTARSELARQGQVVYSPPDVSGWPKGLTVITAASLLSRMNFANDAVGDFDPFQMDIPSTAPAIVDSFLHRLGPMEVDADSRQELIEYLAPAGAALPSGERLRVRLRGLAHLILSLPEGQLL